MKQLIMLIIFVALPFSVQACWDYSLEDSDNIKECMIQAKQGDPEAQANLGSSYYSGSNGVARNYVEAMKWYKKSAVQPWIGVAGAQFYIAKMYAKGWGVSTDLKQAIIWYTKAANIGYPAAQQNLGAMYKNGWGFKKDYTMAHMWFTISVNNGSVSAKKFRDKLGKNLTMSQLNKSKLLADQWIASHR